MLSIENFKIRLYQGWSLRVTKPIKFCPQLFVLPLSPAGPSAEHFCDGANTQRDPESPLLVLQQHPRAEPCSQP